MSTSIDLTTCAHCGHRNPSWLAVCEKCGAGLSLAASDFSQKRKTVLQNTPVAQPQQRQQPSVMMHFLCGWPLVLVGVGGLIGGALGALAYGINVAIYKSEMPVMLKIVLNLGTGAFAIALWLIIAAVLLHK